MNSYMSYLCKYKTYLFFGQHIEPKNCFQIKVNRDANRIITLTRNAIGFWNLENGALEGTVAEKPLGGKTNMKLWSKMSN